MGKEIAVRHARSRGPDQIRPPAGEAEIHGRAKMDTDTRWQGMAMDFDSADLTQKLIGLRDEDHPETLRRAIEVLMRDLPGYFPAEVRVRRAVISAHGVSDLYQRVRIILILELSQVIQGFPFSCQR